MSCADPGRRWWNTVQARLLWTIRVSHSKFPIISRDLASFAWRRILYSRELPCRDQVNLLQAYSIMWDSDNV